MSSKHWVLVGGAVACLVIATQAPPVAASPWLEPGDPRARYALQKLADRRHLDRTVTTWPIMWGSVSSAIAQGARAGDTDAVAQSLAYLRFEQEAQASGGFRAELELAGTSDPVLLRGFDGPPREQGVASAELQWQGEAWAAGLSPTLALHPEDDESIRLDGSYIAGTTANWVFGAGAIERWWGPGWQSSLILSNNARPIPALWLNRKDATQPESDWLAWMGPWQLTLFGGQLESERAVPDAKMLGMRLTLRPVDGLDIGFSRAIMFGGEGRPEDGSTLWNALIGRDNSQDGAANDPGNQLGSIDVRYGFGLGNQAMGLYVQMMGEDEAGAFPARKSWLLGVDWTSQAFGSEQQWYLEYANTLADDFLGEAMPNLTYEHFLYNSGYRFYGRSMAASIDGDAEAVTFGAFHFFESGSNLGASVTLADLNIGGGNRAVITDNAITYNVPKGQQRLAYGSVSYGFQALAGWLELNASIADQQIQLLNGEKDRWSVAASWRYRFQ